MIAYSCLIIVTLVFQLLSEFVRRRELRMSFLISVVGLMTVISAIRFNVGTDFTHYIEFYDWTQEYGRLSFLEKGFVIFLQILQKNNIGYWGIFVFSSILFGVSVFYFIISFIPSDEWCYAVFLFVCTGYFFSSLNIVRQYMAMSIAIFGVIFLFKNRYLTSIVLFITALMFHTSVLFLFLIPVFILILNNRHSKLLLFIIYIISFAVGIIGISSIAILVMNKLNLWTQYAESLAIQDRNNLAVLKALFPNCLYIYGVIVNKNKLQPTLKINIGSRGTIYFDDFINSAAGIYAISQLFFSGFIVYARVSEIFLPFYILFICKTMRNSEPNIKPFISYLIISYYVALTIITIFISNGNGVMPYDIWPALK